MWEPKKLTNFGRRSIDIYSVGITIKKKPIWEWFIPTIYGDLEDGLLLLHPTLVYTVSGDIGDVFSRFLVLPDQKF